MMSQQKSISRGTALRQAFQRLMFGEDGTAGSVLVEATIFVPILVVMSVYAMDFGLTFYNKMEMQNAAQAGAQWAIANRVYNCSSISTAATNATQISGVTVTSYEFCGCSINSSGKPGVSDPNLPVHFGSLHRRPEFDLQLDRRCGKLCHGQGGAHKHVPFVRSPYLWSDVQHPQYFRNNDGAHSMKPRQIGTIRKARRSSNSQSRCRFSFC